ncbi:MAG: 4Fe-4S binding protein [Treponema sp.]|uniref:ATP-binding protein n=1 Tax=Treponema sp. TaxID=166 RepID=UPI002A91F1C7|nr:4Fe-4S dicluster domain-containing protein [Treponema sp.]MDY6397797.1 4Fe-4S binding protein [Treponema sp.]
MIRKIVKIDEEKCTGCGLCASACHENAIVMENGKAHLLRDDFCDGFGDCLPACPAGAISIEERESAEYNPQAVEKRKQNLMQQHSERTAVKSELMQWPVQIKVLPVQAPFYENANLLIAADCTAYAYAAFHRDFIKNHITLVGCPKLDEGDYTEKLTAIISQNNIKSLTIVRMEVPCCGGLERAATDALKASGKFLPWRIIVISRDGEILE